MDKLEHPIDVFSHPKQEKQEETRTCHRFVWITSLSATLLFGGPSFGSIDDRPASQLKMIARFDPIQHETLIEGEMLTEACMSLRLTGEWTMARGHDDRFSLRSVSGAEIEVQVRPGAETDRLPQTHRADREAAALQRSYEEAVGKPVQAVMHEPRLQGCEPLVG